MDFEMSIKKLEEIIKKLEDGDLSLEESLALYKEGAEISLDCQKKLDNAKIVINEISGGKND